MTQGQVMGNPENYRCSKCSEILAGFTSLKPDVFPKPGNLSLCVYCGTLHTFTGDGLARMSLDEESALPADVKRQVGVLRERLKLFNQAKETGLPTAYFEDIERMAEAARAWHLDHPHVCFVLEALDPDRLKIDHEQREMLKQKIASMPVGANVGLIAALDECIEWWGGNEDTRELLRVMDKASGYRATYAQAQVALEQLFPTRNPVQS